MSTRTSSPSAPGWALAAGGALLGAAGLSHPRGDRAGDLDDTLVAMYETASWGVAHVLQLAAVVTIGVATGLALRSGRFDGAARRFAWVLLAGAAVATAEMVPHLLASSEAAELAAGESTPLTDAHLVIQAVSTPLLGMGVAGLALTAGRRLVHPVLVVLGCVGGVALALAGPLVAVTRDPDFGILFMPASGTWLFLVAAGFALRRTIAPDLTPAASPAT